MYQSNGSTDGVTYTRLEDLKNHPKLNALSGSSEIREPRNSDYMSYYDDDTIDLILHKDKDYIRRFKYDWHFMVINKSCTYYGYGSRMVLSS